MPLSKEEQHTLVFLKMAAIELRGIAKEAPELAPRIMAIVQQIDAEAADMERRASEGATVRG
jgi:hypothetical protein